MKAKRIALLSILIAIYVVLAYVGFMMSSNGWKITLEALPILVAGMLLGPIDGLVVGSLGSFIIQLLTYGITPTTIFWILPHAISGLVIGLMAKKWNFELTNKRCVIIAIVSSIIVTALNTLAMYLDAKIMGYSVTILITEIIVRIVIDIVLSVIYSFILPPLLRSLEKFKQ